MILPKRVCEGFNFATPTYILSQMGGFCSQAAPPTSPSWIPKDFQAQFDALKLPESFQIQFVQDIRRTVVVQPANPNDLKVIDVYLDPGRLKQIHQKVGFFMAEPIACLFYGTKGLLLIRRKLTKLDVLSLFDDQSFQCEICYDTQGVTRLWSCHHCSKPICFPCQNKRVVLNTHELCPFCRQKY